MLDTNALYAYIGREKLGLKSDAKIDYNALKTFLDSKVTDKALAASAYIEAMVKYRNEILCAEMIQDFLREKNLSLYNNIQYEIFSKEQYNKSIFYSGAILLEYIKKDILPSKINIEVIFTTCFYSIILLLYTKYKIDESRKICPDCAREIEQLIADLTIEKAQQEFQAVLEEAYNNHANNEEQILKSKYIEKLEEGCQLAETVVLLLSEKGFDYTQTDITQIKDKVSSEYDELRRDNSKNHVMENICKIFASRPDLKEEAINRFADMFSVKGRAFIGKEEFAFLRLQTDYLREELFPSWFNNAQKFRKNDIFDFFFLNCAGYKNLKPADNLLVDTTTYIMTFDKKLARFIEKKRPSNGKIIRRFYDAF